MTDLWKNIQAGQCATSTGLLLGLLAFAAALAVTFLILKPTLTAVTRGEPEKTRSGRIRRIRFALTVASLAFGLFVWLYADLPPDTRAALPSYQLAKLLLIVFTFYGLFEILLTFFADFLPRARGHSPVTPFAKDIVRTILIIVVVMYALRQSFPGADFGALLTTSAILSVVVGLALQESLSNIFAGIMLSIDKPFQPGEWIEFEGKEGKVLDSNWRSTRLWTRTDDVLYVPNSTIAKSNLTNLSRERKHLSIRKIGVEYAAPPNKVSTVLTNMMKQIQGVLADPPPQVRLVDYADSAITYELRFFIEDLDQRTGIEAEVMRGVWYHLKRNGIGIPFPIRDVYLHRAKPESRPQDLVDLLRKVDILKPLAEREFEMLAADLTTQMFAREEVLFRQGDPGTTFYIIKSGSVAVTVKGMDGVEAEVARLQAGQYFGEMSLLTGDSRSSTVKALEDTELLCLDRESFTVLLRENPPIAQSMSEILSSRQADSQQKLAHERDTIIRHRPKGEEGQTKRILEKIWGIFGFKR